MSTSGDITPFTVHEADLAVWHAWPDGMPHEGPANRHLQSNVLLAYRAGLTIRQTAAATQPNSFADWRAASHATGSQWTIESTAPLGALSDNDAPVSSFIPPGARLILVVRFQCTDTGKWRVYQFHDAEVDSTDTADSSQVMITGYHFRAGWMEEFAGSTAATLPTMDPVLCGSLEWCHGERRIVCCRYDAVANTWSDTEENTFTDANGDLARYATRADLAGGGIGLSYLAPRTELSVGGVAGMNGIRIAWVDALAVVIEATASSGLTLQPGWVVQEGAPEPLTIPVSGREWDHAVIRFRFLGRIYATFGYGIFAVPRLIASAPLFPPFDYPIRLGRLLLLPSSAHVLPAP